MRVSYKTVNVLFKSVEKDNFVGNEIVELNQESFEVDQPLSLGGAFKSRDAI